MLRDPPCFRGPGAARQSTGQPRPPHFALGLQEREPQLGYVAEAAGRPWLSGNDGRVGPGWSCGRCQELTHAGGARCMGWMASAARSRTCRSSVRPSTRLAPRARRVAVHRFRDARDFHRFVNSDDLRQQRRSLLAARATRRRGAALLDRQPSRLLVMARAQLLGRGRWQPEHNL